MHPFTPGNNADVGVLDREFDTGALAELREMVLRRAAGCGMPADRAMDVMLAVHELAANAIRHGPGHGRLRMHLTASTLRCEVSDPGPASRDGRAPGSTGRQAAGTPGAVPWPVEQGHGLWLVRKAADHLRVTCGQHGSRVTAVFTLPAATGPWRCILEGMDGKRPAAGQSSAAPDQRETQAAREQAADERQFQADEREALADERERSANERETLADERERGADAREREADRREAAAAERQRKADEREHALGERGRGLGAAAGTLEQDTLAAIERSRESLALSAERLNRQEGAIKRGQQREQRQQARFDRAAADTERGVAAWLADPGKPIERAGALRRQALTVIEAFALTEEEIARVHEHLAAIRPGRRDEYRRTAEHARAAARQAREILRAFPG